MRGTYLSLISPRATLYTMSILHSNEEEILPQKGSKKPGSGWRGNSNGHALAAMGIKTKSGMSKLDIQKVIREQEDAREKMMRKVRELEANQKKIQKLIASKQKMEVAQ